MNSTEHSNLPTIAIFDLDITITKKDTYVVFLLSILRQHPTRLIRCGFLPFAIALHKIGLKNNSWLKETFLTAIAGGLNQTQIDKSADLFIEQLLISGIRKHALKKIQHHKQADHQLILASASFDFYVEKLGRQLGFDIIIATHAQWDIDQKLSGKIKGENCYGIHKLNRLIDVIGKKRSEQFLIAYSDHHSDSPFLEWADQAIAVNPTQKLQQIALEKNYSVENWN